MSGLVEALETLGAWGSVLLAFIVLAVLARWASVEVWRHRSLNKVHEWRMKIAEAQAGEAGQQSATVEALQRQVELLQAQLERDSGRSNLLPSPHDEWQRGRAREWIEQLRGAEARLRNLQDEARDAHARMAVLEHDSAALSDEALRTERERLDATRAELAATQQRVASLSSRLRHPSTFRHTEDVLREEALRELETPPNDDA